VFYLGFSRTGWTNEAIQYPREFQKLDIRGENWRAVGMRLVDLDQLDHDLEHWSEPASSNSEDILF
jgi:hypothetical protein